MAAAEKAGLANWVAQESSCCETELLEIAAPELVVVVSLVH